MRQSILAVLLLGILGGCGIDLERGRAQLQAIGYYDAPRPSYTMTSCSSSCRGKHCAVTCFSW